VGFRENLDQDLQRLELRGNFNSKTRRLPYHLTRYTCHLDSAKLALSTLSHLSVNIAEVAFSVKFLTLLSSKTMSSELILRPAEPGDVQTIFDLIAALAEYEKLSHAVVGSTDALHLHLFGSKPYVEVVLAEYKEKAVGFALFLQSYSTVLTKPGIYLEDLFVLPEYRRLGIGKAIFSYLAQLLVSRECGSLEWSVLDWNEPAIAFYRRMGASIQDDGRICRITGESLIQIASQGLSWRLRLAVPEDLPLLLGVLQQQADDKTLQTLAESTNTLQQHLFGATYIEAALVESEGQVVGFATFFHNYSTFLTKPGLYLDELFVLPSYQSQDIDKAILIYLAQLAVSRDCGRVEWLVEWNEPTISFYESLGASILPDWRVCRITGNALTQLATSATTANIR
jgi:GNAT superfamily N-acetyltransferase